MYKGFQMISFSNQQFAIKLINKLVDTLNLEVKEKMSLRIRHSNVGILLLTNIALALLRQETVNVLQYKSLYATRILENDAFFIICLQITTVKKTHKNFCCKNEII